MKILLVASAVLLATLAAATASGSCSTLGVCANPGIEGSTFTGTDGSTKYVFWGEGDHSATVAAGSALTGTITLQGVPGGDLIGYCQGAGSCTSDTPHSAPYGSLLCLTATATTNSGLTGTWSDTVNNENECGPSPPAPGSLLYTVRKDLQNFGASPAPPSLP